MGNADVEEGRFCVDRTAYIKALEKYRYQCFTRPPRWGKSCLVEMLACYYDNATTPEQWDAWFSGLGIHKKPTPLKGKFEVLQLDFSRAATGSVAEMKARLNTHINLQCIEFARKYGYTYAVDDGKLSALDFDRVNFLLKDDDAMTTLTSLTKAVKARGKQLYLFIDEYDRFANHFLLEREEFDTWGYRAAGRRGLAHQADLHDAQESPGAGPLAPVHHRPFAAGLQRRLRQQHH